MNIKYVVDLLYLKDPGVMFDTSFPLHNHMNNMVT